MSETTSSAVNDINGSNSKQEPDQSTKGRKHGVKYLEERYNKGDRKLSDSPESDDDGDLDTKYMDYPLVSIQVFDKNDKPEKKRLRINSQHICDALAAAAESYPDQQPAGYESPLEIESPFAILYHHRSELQGSRDSPLASDEKREHLNDLFWYLDKEPVAAVPELVKNGLITFEFLWAIFKPGDYLRILDAGNQPQILWLKRVSEKYDYRKEQPYLSLRCLYTCSNGEIVGKAKREVCVYQEEFPWNGPQKITSLSAIPLKHLDDQGAALRIQTGERAIEYYELASEKMGALRRYKGIYEVFVEDPGFGRPDWEPHTTVGRVLIDAKAFMEENPSKKILVTSWGAGDDSKPKSDKSQNEGSGNKDIPSERDILCPPYVYGYCIGMRKWGRFFLGHFSEPGWDEKLWSQHLILPTPQKDLLHAMVSSHLFPSETEIHEEEALKGKGLVVVLHGPPGTGKTLTAAAIAEKTKKPLLLYPAGELGSKLDTVQASIKDIMRHASRWKAILLIDEADVFLESREGSVASQEGSGVAAGNVNLERNALVAVFLRQLEYSQSIIFLTSNRAQMFDPAIKSRVHLSLHYPSPDPKTRRQLWEDKFAKTDPEKLNMINSEKARVLDFVTRYPLNGREISNIFNSAMTLAGHEQDKKLKTVHLETVLNVWEEASDDYSRRAREMGRMLKVFVDQALRGLGLLVLLGLAVIISLHGYQVASKGNRDVLIVYR